MSAPLLLKIVASSVSVASRAGKIIRDILKTGDLGIVQKGFNDLQTEADRSAQRCIVASLNRQYPKASIIGEETLEGSETPADWLVCEKDAGVMGEVSKFPEDLKEVKEEDICIWVDPLDGTAEFTQGLLDHVTVLIGVAWKGRAVGGIIYQPYYNYQAGPTATLGRMIWGIVGLGAYGFQLCKPPSKERIITTTRSHVTEQVNSAIEACQPTEVLRVGGAGHKVLLLIEGKAHCYLFASGGCKRWDTCAPEAVLHAMGGWLTDLHGCTYEYHAAVEQRNIGGTLATCLKTEHAWYMEKVPAEVKESLK